MLRSTVMVALLCCSASAVAEEAGPASAPDEELRDAEPPAGPQSASPPRRDDPPAPPTPPTPPPMAPSPSSAAQERPEPPAETAAPSHRWFRVGAGLGATAGFLEPVGFLQPGIALISEVCPTTTVCVFGSATAEAGYNPPSFGSFMAGAGAQPGLVDVEINTVSGEVSASVGARWVLDLAGVVEVSPWAAVTGGVRGSEVTLTGLDLNANRVATVTTRTTTSAALVVGALVEKELLAGVRVRLSSSVARGAWSYTTSTEVTTGAEPTSDDRTGVVAGLVLRPTVALILAF